MTEVTHNISVARPEQPDTRVLYNIANATTDDVRRLVDDLEHVGYVADWSIGPGYGGDEGEPISGFISRNMKSLDWLREQATMFGYL